MIDKIECSKCLGVGEVLPKEHFGVNVCPKCKGRGTLDWIENIVGVKGTYIKSGVYMKHVDLSLMVKQFNGETMRITEKDLDIGEVICNKCEGGGSWPQLFLDEEKAAFYRCPKCHGDGKLDWIYAVTGKPHNPWIFDLPKVRTTWPKLVASEIVGVQPMDKPTEVKIWQKVDTSWRVLRPLRRLLTIFSKGKGEGGMKISPGNTSPPF